MKDPIIYILIYLIIIYAVIVGEEMKVFIALSPCILVVLVLIGIIVDIIKNR